MSLMILKYIWVHYRVIAKMTLRSEFFTTSSKNILFIVTLKNINANLKKFQEIQLQLEN